ncbi:alpha/beta fold hydrolase [Rhodohalobacter halophilus]|uniref:alpha/beta fold hydrolase n=1 Tax=Rhodohalobacter halophilus TaxID=1812810 RepID=UPI00083FB711|nr:alpha/beta hydrolase [Rhodohalobacter halophilus]
MTPHFFEYQGAKIAWQSTGSGKPLLILHGWGSNSSVMMPLADKLSDIRTCYLIDFPGFGNSPEPPAPWSLDQFAGMVKEYAAHQFGNEAVDLLVHSFGNRVLLKLLTDPDFEKRAGKIIITGGAGLKPKRSFKFYLKKYTAKILKAPLLILPERLQKRGLNALRNTRLWKMLGSSDYQKLSGVMRETFVKTVTEFQDELLPKIDHEALLLWGENDTATPMDQAERLESGLKNGVLVRIEDAGHYAFLDQPNQFVSICRAYLKPDQ